MEYNVCDTCGASRDRAGTLISETEIGGNNCINCVDSLKSGNIIVHAHLPRTVEELTRMDEAVMARNTSAIAAENLVQAIVDPRMDVRGKMLKVGQQVALALPHTKSEIGIGTVVGFTPKMIKVEYTLRGGKPRVDVRKPEQICIIE